MAEHEHSPPASPRLGTLPLNVFPVTGTKCAQFPKTNAQSHISCPLPSLASGSMTHGFQLASSQQNCPISTPESLQSDGCAMAGISPSLPALFLLGWARGALVSAFSGALSTPPHPSAQPSRAPKLHVCLFSLSARPVCRVKGQNETAFPESRVAAAGKGTHASLESRNLQRNFSVPAPLDTSLAPHGSGQGKVLPAMVFWGSGTPRSCPSHLMGAGAIPSFPASMGLLLCVLLGEAIC